MDFKHTVTHENIEFTVTNYQRRAKLSITLCLQRTNLMVISAITCLSACYRLDAGTIIEELEWTKPDRGINSNFV